MSEYEPIRVEEGLDAIERAESIPDGRYLCRIVRTFSGLDKNGNQYMNTTFTLANRTDGHEFDRDLVGREERMYVPLSRGERSRLLKLAAAIKPAGLRFEPGWVPDDMFVAGLEFEAKIRGYRSKKTGEWRTSVEPLVNGQP